MARLVAPPAPGSAWHGPRTEAERWRSVLRPQVLRLIAGSTRRLSWTGRLLTLLLEELYVDDLFTELLGPPQRLPAARYAQAVALAIALRHSWRPDDLLDVATRLGINLEPKAPRHLRAKARPHNRGHAGTPKQPVGRKKRRHQRRSASGPRKTPGQPVAPVIKMVRP